MQMKQVTPVNYFGIIVTLRRINLVWYGALGYDDVANESLYFHSVGDLHRYSLQPCNNRDGGRLSPL